MRSTESIPYSAIFSVPFLFELPKDFQIEEFEGLELCYILSSPSKAKELVVVWKDEAHYRVHQDSLRCNLALPSPSYAGFLADIVQPTESFWNRYPLKDWFLVAAALLGALTVLQTHFADLFDSPDVKVVFADTAAVDVNDNAPFSAQISVLNEDAYAQAKVTDIKASAHCPTGANVTLTPNEPNPPIIGPAQQISLRLDGVAPHRGSNPVEECNLTVNIAARAGKVPGLIWGPKPFSSGKLVRLWPTRVSWSALSSTNALSGNASLGKYLQTEFTIYPGINHPLGATGSISVTSKVDEAVQVSAGRDVEKVIPLPVSPASGGFVIHKFDFQTRSLDKFQTYRISIGLVSETPINSERWRDIVQRVEVFVR
jgi:hypothetical protein